jgi:hypothetical protein
MTMMHDDDHDGGASLIGTMATLVWLLQVEEHKRELPTTPTVGSVRAPSVFKKTTYGNKLPAYAKVPTAEAPKTEASGEGDQGCDGMQTRRRKVLVDYALAPK